MNSALKLIALMHFRKEMRNSFNILIAGLTLVDCVLCLLIMAEYGVVRGFGIHSDIYNSIYPKVVFPLSNMALTGSIYMTVILGIDR